MVTSNTIRPDDVPEELDEQEYLSFLRRESGCSLVRSLSTVQREVFLELACICPENPGEFTVDCCDGENANVNIAGADKLEPQRSPAEQAALQHICNVTQSVLPSVCAAPSPAPLPTPVGPVCQAVSPVANFDVDEYISSSWFIQKQQPNTYQPASALFCAVVTYEKEGRRQWFQEAISVLNFVNEGGVNQGELVLGGGAGFELCATEHSRTAGSFTVGPCFLPSFFGGPYWVVGYSPGRWAIVTGGQPVIEGLCSAEGLCTTRESFNIFNPLSLLSLIHISEPTRPY